MVSIEECLIIFLYFALIVLVIFAIALVIRLMKTLNKVDLILDDVSKKMNKVDGLFELVDTTTNYVSNFSDKIFSFIQSSINTLFRRD